MVKTGISLLKIKTPILSDVLLVKRRILFSKKVTVFSAPECMSKRLKNCIQRRIPKVDAVRDLLSRIDPEEIRRIHEKMVDTMKRNRVFWEETIGGSVVVGIDGVELFSSTKKACPECLNRKTQSGQTEWFHRSVVCMTVGKAPHVILGQEMLKPKDGSGKDEGELTGGKRLIEWLRKRHGHFADVIVADALYLNAPFIKTLKENGLEGVIRLKGKRRLLFQDAERLFNRGEGKRNLSKKGKRRQRYGICQDLRCRTARTDCG